MTQNTMKNCKYVLQTNIMLKENLLLPSFLLIFYVSFSSLLHVFYRSLPSFIFIYPSVPSFRFVIALFSLLCLFILLFPPSCFYRSLPSFMFIYPSLPSVLLIFHVSFFSLLHVYFSVCSLPSRFTFIYPSVYSFMFIFNLSFSSFLNLFIICLPSFLLSCCSKLLFV